MKILRWIGVLPFAIIALALSSIILKFLLILTGEFESDSIMLLIITSVQSGVIFIIVGVKTAPDYKLKTALLLLIIVGLLSVINIFITNNYYPEQIETFRFWVNNLSAIIGSISGYFWAREKYKRN